jgi:hypothetical protein
MRDKLQDKEEYEYVIIKSAIPSLGSVFSGENEKCSLARSIFDISA